ncbi:hypothetical protein OROMI_015125 [Orobanche minor]
MWPQLHQAPRLHHRPARRPRRPRIFHQMLTFFPWTVLENLKDQLEFFHGTTLSGRFEQCGSQRSLICHFLSTPHL